MPNWCANSLEIVGDKDEIKKFASLIEEWTSKNYIENGFGPKWLENIVGNSGLADPCDGSYACRGELYEADVFERGDKAELTLYYDTAWCPATRFVQDLCEKHLPSGYEILYTAEEGGCGIYVTNRDDLMDTYCLDSYGDIEGDFSISAEALKTLIKEQLKYKRNFSLASLIKRAQKKLEVCINKWEYVPIEETD